MSFLDSIGGLTLAQMSAMGTTAGAPAAQVSKGPPAGSGDPGSGPPAAMTGQNPGPPALDTPAAGAMPQRPVVSPHAGLKSVGTHPSSKPISS